MKSKLCILLCLALLLSSCSQIEGSQDVSSVSSDSSIEESQSISSESSSNLESSAPLITDNVTAVPDESITGPWETKGLFTPQEATTTTITSYTILEGTEMENDIVVLTAQEEGPTVFIVASVHGDEVAGYKAADRMKNMELASGTLYILSPANVVGAKYIRRHVYDKQDLNRSFPGKTDGTEAELIAHTIYGEIERIKPDLVFDLHEARMKGENRDNLGSSLIYTALDGMEDLFLDMYMATQNGELCTEPYKFFAPGPNNSINSVITTELKIPVITVETYRAYKLERRIEDQMAIVGYALNYLGMV